MLQVTINIANDFSKTPGARTKKEGPHSGQEFREKFLEKYFSDPSKPSLVIILDGADGYATSFLEEAFGGLARQFGRDEVLSRIQFISHEDSILIDEIKGYINEANS